MSEGDSQRLALLGVGPHSRSLKFLNTKNNIASMRLKKQLASIERQKTFNINVMELERLNTQDFLKHVRKLEHDTKAAKALLGKDSDSSRSTTPPTSRDIRRRRKIRLAQTAPAHMQHPGNETSPEKSATNDRKPKSGPETQEQKDHLLKMDRKSSMFLQLSGRSRQKFEDQGDEEEIPSRHTRLPKPNPKTLLDVMIGLNAFSHVPPRGNSSFIDDGRTESRCSTFDNESSIYDSSENIAKSFMQQWQKKVAMRKNSILHHLEAPTPQPNHVQRSESIALRSVPEESPLANQLKKRRSKWSVRHSMQAPSLPAINDEDERKEQFLAWVKEEKNKNKEDIVDIFEDIDELDAFEDANLIQSKKLAKRRRSFANWIKSRQNADKQESSDEEDETLGFSGGFRDIPEEDDSPTDIGDLMKTILKIKTKFKDPIDARIKRFNNDIEKIKERDDAVRNKPMSKEQKRKWKLLLKGIDAGFGESSDDEDNFYSSVLY